MNIGQLLSALEARLPELEWRMGSLGSVLSESALPKGLFRPCLEPNPAFYIAEIKADIKALTTQENIRSAHYLANRIHQKINVLITLCHIQDNDPKIQRPLHSFMTMISTRKQCVESLELDIQTLEAQAKAMEETNQKLQAKGDVEALLKLQTELGLVKKKLTLAREKMLEFQTI